SIEYLKHAALALLMNYPVETIIQQMQAFLNSSNVIERRHSQMIILFLIKEMTSLDSNGQISGILRDQHELFTALGLVSNPDVEVHDLGLHHFARKVKQYVAQTYELNIRNMSDKEQLSSIYVRGDESDADHLNEMILRFSEVSNAVMRKELVSEFAGALDAFCAYVNQQLAPLAVLQFA